MIFNVEKRRELKRSTPLKSGSVFKTVAVVWGKMREMKTKFRKRSLGHPIPSK